MFRGGANRWMAERDRIGGVLKPMEQITPKEHGAGRL